MLRRRTFGPRPGRGASGAIRGTVTDATGAVVPHAAVQALDVDRGQTYDTFTDAGGQYQFNSLPPATYNVTARNTGFQTETQTSLALNIGQVAVVDFHLKVAHIGDASDGHRRAAGG